jgi:5-methylcytosine-specific restriction endonuclease McrA
MGTLDHLNLPSEPPAPKQKWADKTRVEVKREAENAAEANWRAVCVAVDMRDKLQCRVCRRHTSPWALTMLDKGHRHHIVFRSAGGEDSSANVCILCSGCHALVHAHKLQIEGNADVALAISRRNLETGEMEVWKQEVSPRVYVGAA